MDFYDAFLKYAQKLRKSGQKLIICGDFNTAHKEIDLARPKENVNESGFLPEERAWMDKFVAKGYIDTFRHFSDLPEKYTWWHMRTRARERNVGWRIDYFFASQDLENKLDNADIHDQIQGSDHCPVSLSLKV
jgi:exodeoxyribonuclease-3